MKNVNLNEHFIAIGERNAINDIFICYTQSINVCPTGCGLWGRYSLASHYVNESTFKYQCNKARDILYIQPLAVYIPYTVGDIPYMEDFAITQHFF